MGMAKRIVYALPAWDSPPAEATGEGAERRFEKELIREGTWVHPTKKFTFRVTGERLRGWAAAFRRMRAAGLKVPLPFGHSYDPRDNAGFLDDLRVEGNRLVGVLAIPRAEDAERLGTTIRDVSVSVNPDFVDARGNRLGEVIEHVALTTAPLVEGQSNFAPVERVAAEGGDETEVWTFAATPDDTAEDAETAESAGDVEALRVKLARERSARIEAEVTGHVQAGRLPPAARGLAAALLAYDGAARLDLDAHGGAPLDVAATTRQLLSLLPTGGVDLADRTRRLRALPNPGAGAVVGGRAAAQAAKRMLESRGYTVTLSDDGAAVLEAQKIEAGK
jgi:hypothetical protein